MTSRNLCSLGKTGELRWPSGARMYRRGAQDSQIFYITEHHKGLHALATCSMQSHRVILSQKLPPTLAYRSLQLSFSGFNVPSILSSTGIKPNLPLCQCMKGCVFSFTSSETLERKAGYSGSWKQSRRRTSPEANAIMIPFWLAVRGEGII